MKNYFFVVFFLIITSSIFAQYNYRDGNRIGISAGISQTSLFTSNFDTKPGIGFAGGLSVRGNYYDNWSMIYGMQFFYNKFAIESTSITSFSKQTDFNLQGVQVRLLLSYNVIEDHVSIDFGPVLQVNGKLNIKASDENNLLNGTSLQAKQILDVSPINGNAYAGISAGNKVVRAVFFYEYGFTNLFGKLNKDEELKVAIGSDKLKGNLGTINCQIIFNL